MWTEPPWQSNGEGKETAAQDGATNTSYVVLMLILTFHIKPAICSKERFYIFIHLLSQSLAFLIFTLIISEKVLKNFLSQSHFNVCQKQEANL